jgi:ribosomal protein S18 acetylase RimI-like enzyme
MVGQQGTFLTMLGEGVLGAFYGMLPRTRTGFGFASVDDAGRPTGIITATTDVRAFFLECGTVGLGTMLPPLLKQLARHPSLIWHSVETVTYPFLVGSRRDEPPSIEMLSFMVAPEHRNHGIGAQLIDRQSAYCREEGIEVVKLTVDAKNEGAQRFYRRHGFVHHKSFMLYGRPMAQYRLTL